ncbi:hypothetical protein [Streptomyces bobili]|uniref:hypothetical protein n=1 Tax=Streptomyces bobili TaxID=67280 RepID=UPI0037FE30A7
MVRKYFRAATAVATLLLVGFVPTPSQAVDETLVLQAVRERESNGNSRAFELYGNFPGDYSIHPIVSCNNTLMQSEVMDTPGLTQINVNVEQMPAGSTCTFQLERLYDGARTAQRTVSATSAVSIQINGVQDRGVTSGRRVAELYGTFANPLSLEPSVVCKGRYAGGRVEFASLGQINISFPDDGPTSGCSFSLRNKSTGIASPTFGAPLPKIASFPSGFGGYNWGGVPAQSGNKSSLEVGQEYLNNAGFDTTRLVIQPSIRNGRSNSLFNHYNMDLDRLDSACPDEKAFLPCAIKTPEFQAAISSPSLKKIVLSAYDSTTDGPRGGRGAYLDIKYLSENSDAVIREYRDLTLNLYQTQHDTNKTFVVTSWEADNQAYCGSFYSYLTSESFRNGCGSITSRSNAISAITMWFELRRQGILAGRQLAAAAGYGGVTVSDGIEFNMNTLTYPTEVDGRRLSSILLDVIPLVNPDYALYSSYDSQGRGSMEDDLSQIRGWLSTNASNSKLAIGEVGFQDHGINRIDASRTVETVKAIQRANLPIVILWEAFDTFSAGRIRPYGVLHASGETRAVTDILRNELSAQAAELQQSQVIKIAGATDRGVSSIGGRDFRTFEIYGSSLNNVRVTALCDGTEGEVSLMYQSPGQANIRFPVGSADRYCTIRFSRAFDNAKSLEYGPVVV